MGIKNRNQLRKKITKTASELTVLVITTDKIEYKLHAIINKSELPFLISNVDYDKFKDNCFKAFYSVYEIFDTTIGNYNIDDMLPLKPETSWLLDILRIFIYRVKQIEKICKKHKVPSEIYNVFQCITYEINNTYLNDFVD